MGEGGDLLQPLGGLHGVGGVELTELPGVGNPADAVTHNEQAHDGQADLRLGHLNRKIFKTSFSFSLFYLITVPPHANIVANNTLDTTDDKMNIRTFSLKFVKGYTFRSINSHLL